MLFLDTCLSIAVISGLCQQKHPAALAATSSISFQQVPEATSRQTSRLAIQRDAEENIT